MQAACWGLDHFSTYLKVHKFILFTNHKPLETLSTVHTKTLARINEYMGTYNFKIRHKKEMKFLQITLADTLLMKFVSGKMSATEISSLWSNTEMSFVKN